MLADVAVDPRKPLFMGVPGRRDVVDPARTALLRTGPFDTGLTWAERLPQFSDPTRREARFGPYLPGFIRRH